MNRAWDDRAPRYTSETMSVHDWFAQQLGELREWAGFLTSSGSSGPDVKHGPTPPDAFFRFIPEYVGTIQPGNAAAEWKSPCFASNSGSGTWSADGAEIELKVAESSSLTCSDSYIILTVEGFHVTELFLHGTHKISWKFAKNITEAESTWVKTNGFRVFRFLDNFAKMTEDVAATLELFYPVIHHSPSVPEASAKANIKFLKDYANVTMEPRSIDVVNLNETEFQSGDFLGIIRLDGLDTMQVYGTGAHTGHTAMFMRLDGVLHVVESTDKTNYWPNPNIQKTPWSEWFPLAQAAEYNIRHLPLSPEARAKFNVTAATEFFNKVEGVPYGYHNFLWGWIDTPEDNLPGPLSTQFLEPAFALVAKYEPQVSKRMWEEAFNMRLQSKDLTTVEIYNALAKQNLTFGELMSLPEQDSWVYSDGPSMVCDVFVCEMYKAGGLFGSIADQIQCTEFQNWDVETLNFFDLNYTRPQACVEADPMLPTCQLAGKYRLRLPGFGTVEPYPHMREHCPAVAPEFHRPAGC